MALVRDPAAVRVRTGVDVRGFALGRPFDPACVDGADVVVHAAVVPHREGATDTVALNVEGARQLREAAFEIGRAHV